MGPECLAMFCVTLQYDVHAQSTTSVQSQSLPNGAQCWKLTTHLLEHCSKNVGTPLHLYNNFDYFERLSIRHY